MEKTAILILGAGLGKRMCSDLPKVLHQVDGKPLIEHVLTSAVALELSKLVVVTGHARELVESSIRKALPAPIEVSFAYQAEQRGTGHAVRCALPELGDFEGPVTILYGDMPLIQANTLQSLLSLHSQTNATISLISLVSHSASSFGRIVRDKASGAILKIVEAKDCSPAELAIPELNVGIYVVDSAFLKPAVNSLKNENVQKEFYLTDIVEKAASEGQRISSLNVTHEEEFLGVNDRWDLLLIERAVQARRVKELVLSGVEVLDPSSLLVGPRVEVAPGAHIGPNTQLVGTSKIEAGVVIEGCCYLSDTVVATGAHLKLGVRAEKSEIGRRAMVGPFAHLREGSLVGEEAKIGNFVETKKAILNRGAKVSHLTYLGDCTVGEEANIGAGTITCNFDGVRKHKTTIGKGAFIGSNTVLIAPVSVDDGAYVGAGSAISKDVPKDALAFTRAPLVVKAGWAKKKRGD